MSRSYTGVFVGEHVFPSWYEAVNHACNAKAFSNGRRSRIRSSEAGWYGTKTWEGAVTLAREGYPELANTVKAMSDNLFTMLSKYCLRTEPRYVTEGYGLDTGRWVEGEPEHWLLMEDEETLEKGNKLCRIVFNQSASSGISTDVMKAKGATIASLIRLLDYCGIRTELELIGLISPDGFKKDDNTSERIIYRIAVKKANQDLDFDLTAFAIGHPASLRRIGFAILETFPKEVCEKFHISNSGNYSYTSDLNAYERSPCDIYVGSSMLGEPQWTDIEAAQKWIMSELRKQGANMKEDTI